MKKKILLILFVVLAIVLITMFPNFEKGDLSYNLSALFVVLIELKLILMLLSSFSENYYKISVCKK